MVAMTIPLAVVVDVIPIVPIVAGVAVVLVVWHLLKRAQNRLVHAIDHPTP